MAAEPVPGESGGLLQGRFEGREAFAELVRQALQTAAREGWREIVLCDPTFEDWPLGERAVAAALQAWARPGRRMTLLACRYDEVLRRHARFVEWRRTWDHLLQCRSCRSDVPEDFPSALWSPHWGLQRLDREHCTGYAGSGPERRVALKEQLDECLRRSAPAFPASTLGL